LAQTPATDLQTNIRNPQHAQQAGKVAIDVLKNHPNAVIAILQEQAEDLGSAPMSRPISARRWRQSSAAKRVSVMPVIGPRQKHGVGKGPCSHAAMGADAFAVPVGGAVVLL
jgi:hypothetical protein